LLEVIREEFLKTANQVHHHVECLVFMQGLRRL